MPLMMTKGEFAAHMSVGPSAVSNWAKKGLLVLGPDPERPGKELVDADKSKVLIRGTIDQTRGRPRTADRAASEQPAETLAPPPPRGPAAMSLTEVARLEEMQERTTRRRIENGQLLGQLVSLQEYERRAGDMGRMIRERSHGLLRQMAERLAAESDPRSIVTLFGDALDKMFNQVAGEIEAAADTERAVDAALAATIPDEEEAELDLEG